MIITKEIENTIHDLAVKQITADFAAIKENAHSNHEQLYAFATGIVADVTGFFSVGNTVESLKRILEKYEEKDFHASYFWWISNWEYKGINDNALFNFLDQTFYSDDFNWEKMDILRKAYEPILIKALKTCDKNGVFGIGKERENIVIYIQYVDSCDENFDDISSEQVNPKNIHLLFKERWNDKQENLTKIITQKLKAL